MSKARTTQENILHGTPVSPGIARGPVRVVGSDFDKPPPEQITTRQVARELRRFKSALDAARQELEKIIADLGTLADKGARDILEMHLMVLDDTMVADRVTARVRDKLESADTAYHHVVRDCMDAFHRMPDDYLRERALDIRDVGQRVMRHLRGETPEIQHHGPPSVCVAHDLTPSETAQLDRSKVLGFAVEHGSMTSHTAIMARSLGLPAVARIHGLLTTLHHDDEVILDGDGGLLIINPTPETQARYRKLEREADRKESKLLAECKDPAVTLDGRRITVAANAEFIEEMPHISGCGAEGVGLFRTEFVHLENRDADEAALTKIYSQVVKAAAPHLVIFRTLDLGGDKIDNVLHDQEEQNPFLGWRGIRVSLARHDLFKRQLRAILRAGAHGEVGIMYPMISGVGEVVAANKLLAECRSELQAERVRIPEKVQVGAMIEIPSAAAIADLLAPHVDFFSIGTNDLTQYTLAVDRVNERVADLYQPSHPAVLRLIKMVVEASHRAGIWTGMCGEMAGDISLTPLLVGLGLDELSAASGQVAKIKHAIRKLDAVQCSQLLEQVLCEADPAAIRNAAHEFAVRHYAELFD